MWKIITFILLLSFGIANADVELTYNYFFANCHIQTDAMTIAHAFSESGTNAALRAFDKVVTEAEERLDKASCSINCLIAQSSG